MEDPKVNIFTKPYMKSKMNIIQVDNTNDIEFDKINFSNEDYRKLAKELISKGMFFEAYCVYADTLKNIKDQKELLSFRLNIAIMCMKLNLKQEYEANIKMALKIDPCNEKAHYHLIKCETINTDKIAKDKFDKLRQKVKENNILQPQSKQELRKYIDFHESYQTNKKVNCYDAIITKQVGQYFDPTVKLGKSKFGRGLFATKNMPAGHIIAIQHPLFYMTSPQDEYRCRRYCQALSDLFIKSQQTRSKIYNLYLSLNKPKQNGINDIKQEDLYNLAKTYSFRVCQPIDYIYRTITETMDTSLIYQKCSLFNHNCDSKCRIVHFGNTILIYTIEEIKENEQILISYFQSSNYQKRTESLLNWNIKCDCQRCDSDRRKSKGEKVVKKISNRQKQRDLFLPESMTIGPSFFKDMQKVIIDLVDLDVVSALYKISEKYHKFSDKMLTKIFPMSLYQAEQLRQCFLPKDLSQNFKDLEAIKKQ